MAFAQLRFSAQSYQTSFIVFAASLKMDLIVSRKLLSTVDDDLSLNCRTPHIVFPSFMRWFICVHAFQGVYSSGYFELRLKSFEDFDGRDINKTCCDGFDAATNACNPCDHFIFVCLLDGRDHGHG